MLVADKIAQLAELLASQGCLSSAMGYLLQLPRIAETSTYHATLIHRIAGSGDVSLAQPAASPFDMLYAGVAKVAATQEPGPQERNEQQQFQQHSYQPFPAYASHEQVETVHPPGGTDESNGSQNFGFTQAPAIAAPAEQPAEVPYKSVPAYDASAVINTLQSLIAGCSAYELPPIDKRKLDDIEKRATGLYQKLGSCELSKPVFDKLLLLCQALAAGDARAALDLHVSITTTDWADNGSWLMGLKRLIELVSKLGLTL